MSDELKRKYGLCAEDATHKLFALWTGLDVAELKEGEQLEIQVAGRWIEAELEREPDGSWSWRDLMTGWKMKRTDAMAFGVRKEEVIPLEQHEKEVATPAAEVPEPERD